MRLGAGGVRCHLTEGVAEERRGGGSRSGRQAGVGSGSGRRAGVGSVRGSPYNRQLTKTKFLERVSMATRAAGLDPLQGHGIRIGATLEYLLRGVPFDVMKAKGRWASDAVTNLLPLGSASPQVN